MNNDATALRWLSDNSRLPQDEERNPYDIEKVYDTLIYPFFQAAAASGETSYIMSIWTLNNFLPRYIEQKELFKYIQEEKNIRIHNYGDTISFFW